MIPSIRSIAAGVALFAAEAYAQTAPAALNRWTQTASLTDARAEACAAILNDGRLLVAGGVDASGPVATVDIYGSDGAFTAGVPMSQARAAAACVTMNDGRVLVSGGDGGNGSLNTAEIFDPVSNQWTPTGSLTVAREGHRMAVTAWGVWVAGGTDNGVIDGTLELFNPAAGQFQALGALHTPRAEFAMAASGRMLVIAGGTDGIDTLSTIEVYDGALGALRVAGPMLQARKDFSAAALLDGRILIGGGLDANGALLSSTEIFDSFLGTSVPGPPLLEPRANHSSYALPHNGSVLIYGGTGTSGVLATTEIYAPWTGSISPGSPLNNARRDEAKAALGDGSYMIAGGRNDAGPIKSSEEFRFSTIATDKDDYAPGTAVKISGGGWAPGERVLVSIAPFPAGRGHIRFTSAVTADGLGNIQVPGFAVNQSDFGRKFVLTALGSQSRAETTFTDGLNPSFQYQFNPPSGAATPGQSVTVTVTVSPNPLNTGPQPTGEIAIYTNGSLTNLTISGPGCNNFKICTLSPGANNTATSTVTFASIPADTTTFSIQYSGDANYSAEVPNATYPIGGGTPIVDYAAPNKTITTLTGPASVSFGSQQPYTATVCISSTGASCDLQGNLTGQFQFFVNGAAYGSPVPAASQNQLAGTAIASFIPNPPLGAGGSYAITATYENDTNNLNSTSNAVITTVAGAPSTTITLVATPNPAPLGQTVVLMATVIGPNGSSTPTGWVQFMDDGVNISLVQLIGGVAAYADSSLTLGTHAIVASYIPNIGYPPATVSIGVVITKLAPSVTFSSMPQAAVYGQPVALTLTLMAPIQGGATPTGTVQFLVNGLNAGAPVPIVNGVATLTFSNLPLGVDKISFGYIPDRNSSYASLPAMAGMVAVTRAQTTTLLALTVAGSQMTVTATVGVVAPGAGAPTGMVQFTDSTTNAVLGTATLSASLTATISTPATNDTIVASYSGDTNFVASVSPAFAAVPVVNAASYTSSLAPDTIATGFGVNLATQGISGVLPLTTTLGGDSLTVTDSAGVSRPALLFYISPLQLSFLIPSGTAVGQATVTVVTPSGSSTTPMNILASASALFTANANGMGPLAAQVFSYAPGGQFTYVDTAIFSGTAFVNAPVSLSPASNTYYLLLYGAGFDNAKTVTVSIGGQTFTPSYFGPQGVYPGLDQVNIPLPQSLSGAGQVNVSVMVDGQVSNVGTMSFAAAGTN